VLNRVLTGPARIRGWHDAG